MKKCLLMLLVLAFAGMTSAQKITVPELYSWLDWPVYKVDTVLKHRGYLLMQKDVDSSNSLYVYSHLEHEEGAPAVSRSLTYGEVSVKDLKSRMMTYRTYSKAEYQDLMSYLLQHNFTAKHQFDFKDSKHTIYENGQQSIRVKVNNVVFRDGRKYTSYELEVGK